MGSNGLTSARHDLFARYLAGRYSESYDTALPAGLVYSGTFRLTDRIEGLGIEIGKLALSPTRTYAPVVKALLDRLRPAIHGMVHCSGGAQTKIMNFVENKRITKNNLFPIPPLFRIIQQESNTDWKEMYKVFNMGHRMEICTSPADAGKVVDISQSFGVEARIIGFVEEAEKNELIIESEQGRFIF
jgi:phosphoribosylformylglycinamidine cyclo-ligase